MRQKFSRKSPRDNLKIAETAASSVHATLCVVDKRRFPLLVSKIQRITRISSYNYNQHTVFVIVVVVVAAVVIMVVMPGRATRREFIAGENNVVVTTRTVDFVWPGVTLITPGIKHQRKVHRVRFAMTRICLCHRDNSIKADDLLGGSCR